MLKELTPRIGYMGLYVARDSGFRGCRSLRELIGTCGYQTMEKLVIDVEELPTYGLLNLAEVEQPDIWKLPRTLSGIRELDRAIGGFFPGELSIWTGKRGGGKSTLSMVGGAEHLKAAAALAYILGAALEQVAREEEEDKSNA